jgi:hypothetical protein
MALDQGFFFVANFRHLATKKMGWRIQQRDFWELKIYIRHISPPKKKGKKSPDLDIVFH